MKNSGDLPILYFESQPAWEAWLAERHQVEKGLWLKMAKKSTGIPSVNYQEAVESALCFGWIDGQKASFDEQYWLQKFTPRGPKSMWSKINREKALALIGAGKMQPAGQRQVELAQADGRWEAAYSSQSTIDVPADFQTELDKDPAAKAFFESLKSANRYAILLNIHQAKKPETRLARIRKYVEMCAQGEKLYP
jgi:uncharacterized protein YdeI (YjbR/CyaY-like superfamily)